MLLFLCALGAALIAVGAVVCFGPGVGLMATGVLVVAWAVAWDLLQVDGEPEDGE